MSPEFRQFAVPDDFPRLVELKNAYLADFGRTTTEERQRFLLSLRDHDAAADNRVVVHPDNPNQLIGHIWVWQQTVGRIVYDLVIHPQWQRQGLGSHLLEWAMQRARTLNATHIDAQVDVTNLAEIRFTQKHGFRPLGTYLRMNLLPDVPLPDVVLPDDFELRTYQQVQDITTYAMLMNRGYGDLWGHSQNVSEADHAQGLANFDPDGIFLLYTSSGEPVGIGRAQTQTQTNVQDGSHTNSVDVPGIVPSYRHPALYHALLLHSLHWVRDRMPTPGNILLDSWGDFDSTVDTFWQIGFTVEKHAIGYRLYL